jgi:hypothetical protein
MTVRFLSGRIRSQSRCRAVAVARLGWRSRASVLSNHILATLIAREGDIE